MAENKIIQISTAADNGDSIYALTENGDIWCGYWDGHFKWNSKLPPLPSEEEDDG